jgi:hypothetical protein
MGRHLEGGTRRSEGRFAMTAVFAAAAFAMATLPAQAQVRRQPGPQRDSAGAPVEISLQVGTRKYQSNASGECRSAPQASIYGVRAALHSVSQRDGNRSISLTLWQPAGGAPAMMNLHVAEGKDRYEVDTVKAGTKQQTQGSGKATFQPTGGGGTFTIDAVTATGEKVGGTIRCAAFSAIHAEGG